MFTQNKLSKINNKEYNKDKYYTQRVKETAYIFQEYKLSSVIYRDLLWKIYHRSGYDWSLILIQFRNEDYIWWSYVTYKQSRALARFIDILEMESCNLGYPQNIIKIVEIINFHCYFNRRIRYFYTLMSWANNIFIYYNRYYRYQKNNRIFDKKVHLNLKHGHKLHFVLFLYHRQVTGVKLNKNHLRYWK